MANLEPGKWDPMLWVDLETTGLDPQNDDILEIAAIITDENLDEVGRFHQVWWSGYPHKDMDPVVLEMHTNNGLLQESDKAPGRTEGWGQFQYWLSETWPTSDKIILAGSGVHFDKAFLEEWGLGEQFDLHYRVFDTSTLKRFWVGAGHPPPEEESYHRALPDVHNTLLMTRTLVVGLRALVALANA